MCIPRSCRYGERYPPIYPVVPVMAQLLNISGAMMPLLANTVGIGHHRQSDGRGGNTGQDTCIYDMDPPQTSWPHIDISLTICRMMSHGKCAAAMKTLAWIANFEQCGHQ